MASIVRLLSLVLAWTGVAALLPALVSTRWEEGHAAIFLATTLGCIFFAGVMRFSSAGLGGRIRRFQVFGALAALWVLVPLAATPAIAAAAKLDIGPAWFEAVSAFTTTGFTAIETGPRSLFVWFALLQWSGGLLTLISGLAVLAPSGMAGLPDRAMHHLDELDAVDTEGVLKDVVPVYAAGTFLTFVALLFAGNAPFSSFCLATAAISAGAHLPPEAKVALETGEATRWVVLPVLLWAATSVRWHKALVSRRIHAAPEQRESLVLLGYFVGLGLVLSVILFRLPSDLSVREALGQGLFAAASLISTSGIVPAPDTYAGLPAGLLILVALVGGGALSVAGGLKILRVRAMLARAQGDLMRLISPHIVLRARTGEGGVGSAMRGVWVGTVAMMMMLGLTIVLMAMGAPSFEAALTGSVAALTNTGPLYDASGAGWPAISDLPPLSALGAVVAMIAGRLETVGAFVLVHLIFWRT
ncbi:TrkH family potassium uptake protein [Aquabacter spiritensis]|uniref:Trk system potassium uptake protein TrkH n=1 Tax=Aquabacter spiritensis TaxID=933073 RepID=A0A4R3LXV8_9HYPH|nr:TrkH family potassium uptake protein [Aquabacter spiritensis]TCT03565.1 trk system potassium uptake protein TrkH [Aquabacter spiritensis]